MIFLNSQRTKLCCFWLCFLFVHMVQAQYNESILSDRPGQTLSANTVGKWIFQWQMGLNTTGNSSKEFEISDYNFVNVHHFRLGFSDRWEIGVDLEYLKNIAPTTGAQDEANGLSELSYNLRGNVIKGNGLKPALAVFFKSHYGIINESFLGGLKGVAVGLATNQTFLDNWAFSTNLTARIDNLSSSTTLLYSIKLSKAFSNDLSVFLEHYSEIMVGNWQPRFDAGVLWRINHDLQIDLHGGYNNNRVNFTGPGWYDFYNSAYSQWFLSAGVSWRVSLRKRNH